MKNKMKKKTKKCRGNEKCYQFSAHGVPLIFPGDKFGWKIEENSGIKEDYKSISGGVQKGCLQHHVVYLCTISIILGNLPAGTNKIYENCAFRVLEFRRIGRRAVCGLLVVLFYVD
jgi:hypothetical protein